MPQPRPLAPTLRDRGMVYQPNQIKGNKPVTIGHQSASVALLPNLRLHRAWIMRLSQALRHASAHSELLKDGRGEQLGDCPATPPQGS